MPTEVHGSSISWFDDSVDRALHLYRRGHGFESRPTSEVVYITVMINPAFITLALFLIYYVHLEFGILYYGYFFIIDKAG